MSKADEVMNELDILIEKFWETQFIDADISIMIAKKTTKLMYEVRQLQTEYNDTINELSERIAYLSAAISPRQAFRVFIRFELEDVMNDRFINLTDQQLEDFANGIEDDDMFYNALDEFLADYINDYGSNYF